MSTCNTYSTCCEHNIEVNRCLQLQLPGIAVSSQVLGLNKNYPSYISFVGASSIAETGQVTSAASNAYAVANKISLGADFQIDYVVTASQLSQLTNSLFGFTSSPSSVAFTTINFGIGVDTAGNVQAFESGLPVGTSPAAAAAGQVLTISLAKTGVISYALNGVTFHTSTNVACADLFTVFFAGAANVSIGGPAVAAWSIVTSGTAATTGTISPTGLYCAPCVGGDFVIRGDINGFTWDTLIRVTKPTQAFSDLNDFSEGEADVWLNTAYVPHGSAPRLASDGSPDAFTSSNAVYVGETVDGFEFEYAPTFTEHKSDRGLYKRTLREERAYLRFQVLEVKALDKIALLQPSATITSIPGARQMQVGGRACSTEFSVTIVKKTGECDDQNPKFDTVQLHRVTSVKGYKTRYSREGRQMIEVELEVLLDNSRPKNDQLYTVTYQNGCA